MNWLLKDAVILFIGGLLGWLGNYYFYQKGEKANVMREDETIARYVVLAMSPRYPIKDSRELDRRVESYLDALRRSKADGRGVPVYRDDGSIGIDWSLKLNDSLQLNESH